MKKKIVLFFAINIAVLGFAQEDNVFADSDAESQTASTPTTSDQPIPGEQDEGAGNPGPKAPIDDYIPLLFLSGFAIAVYATMRNKKLKNSIK